MSYTRNELRTDLQDSRVGASLFTNTQLDQILDACIESLYPTYYLRQVDTTTAGAGLTQTLPSNARNIHSIIVADTRPRPLRGWTEGDGLAYVPNAGPSILGKTLVWGWTKGWTAPASGSDSLDIVPEAHEYLLIRAHIACLNNLLTSRFADDKFFNVNVRPKVSEQEITAAIDSLHQEARMLADQATPLPEVER